MANDDVEKADDFDEDDEGEKRRKEEEELKKQKEKQAMLDNLYVLICMIIIIAGAVVIVIMKIHLFPDEKIITFVPLPQQKIVYRIMVSSQLTPIINFTTCWY